MSATMSNAAVDRLVARIEKRRARLSPEDTTRFDHWIAKRWDRETLDAEQLLLLRRIADAAGA